jgi:hypothetical protein
MKLTGLNNTTYTLEPTPIRSGGEGDIYRIRGSDAKVAKVYKPGVIEGGCTKHLSKTVVIATKITPM